MATQDEVKVYTPEVIADQPFPISGEGALMESNSSSTQSSKGVYGAKETPEKQFPQKMVAKELFSTAINTISKKILKVFEFAKSGAIQIGEYINGVSGEIKISPDGIVAKNKSGVTTFAVDGDTGNAIFSGDVRASTFTTDFFTVDSSGNVVANSIVLAEASTLAAGVTTNLHLDTQNDRVVLTGSTITTTFIKPTVVMLMFNGYGYFQQGASGNFAGNLTLTIDDGFTTFATTITAIEYNSTTGISIGPLNTQPISLQAVVKLAAGTYSFVVASYLYSSTGTVHYTMVNGKLSYVTLGNY